MLWQPLFAQRIAGGGLNYSPRPAVYAVIAVDPDERTVLLRAADGRTGTVYVDEAVYDVSAVSRGNGAVDRSTIFQSSLR